MALGASGHGALRRATLLVPFAFLLLAPGSPARAAGGPIVIGTSISKTGPLAEDADYQIKGLELAVADANAKGGWLGRKVELKLYDDKSEAGTGVRLYTRLITQDKVDLLIGPYSSGITQAVAPLINKYHFATVEPGASLPDIYVPGNHWNIQGTASSLSYLEPLMPLAQKTYGAKTVAILGLKSAFSLACYNARLEQAKKLGLEVVYQATYSLPQPDFASIALAIKNADPDVVIGCTYYPDAVGIAQALHGQGFAPKLLAETIGPVEAAFVKALGPVANGIIANTGWWYNFKTPDNEGFIARYKAKFNEEPDYHAASGYAAVEVLGAAVQHTRSLDQTKLRDWLLHSEVPTIQGTFKVDPNGLSIGYGQDMVQVQNGDIKLVWPDDLAQAKLIEPYPGS